MKRLVLLLLLIVFIVSFATRSFAEEQIVVVLSDMGYMPFYTKDATEGIYIDLMREFEKQHSEFNIVLEVVPRKRMDRMMDDGTAQVFSVTNPFFLGDKASNFLFTKPFWLEEGVVFMKKDNVFSYKGPEDLFGKTLGIILGNQYPAFQKYFDSGQIKTHAVQRYIQLAKMLQRGRIDAFLGDKTPVLYEMKANGLDPSDFVTSDVSFFAVEFMMQVQKTHQHFVEKMNVFLEQSKENGFLQELERKYLR